MSCAYKKAQSKGVVCRSIFEAIVCLFFAACSLLPGYSADAGVASLENWEWAVSTAGDESPTHGWRKLDQENTPQGPGIIWLRTTLPDLDVDDRAVFIERIIGDFEAIVDGQVLYRYGNASSTDILRGSPYFSHLIPIHSSPSKGSLIIKVAAFEFKIGFKGKVWVGNTTQLSKAAIKRDILPIVLYSLCFTYGLILLLFFLFRRNQYDYLQIGMSGVCLAFLMLLYTPSVPLFLFSSSPEILETVGKTRVYFLALTLIGFFSFLDTAITRDQESALRWCRNCHWILLIAVFCFDVLTPWNSFSILASAQYDFFASSTFLVSLLCLLRYYHKNVKSRAPVRIIIGGELILITFVLLAILLENGSISNQLGLISCGVFGLFAILLFSLGRNFSYVFKKNVEHAVNESRILAELAEAVKLKKIFNSINEGILTFDSKFRVDEQFSSRLPQILRVPIDSIADADVGQLLFEKARFSSCDRETYRQSLSNTFQSNSAALDSEYSSLPREFIIDLDDGEHILEVEWTPFLNPSSKNVEKMMVTIRDLTIRRRMETQLAFSSRMAAFGKMAGGMGHEINNPITVVIWRASQLQKFLHAPKLDNEKIKSFLIAIDRMVQRIQNIANGMLTFAKQTDDEPLKVGKLIDMIECALMLSQTRAKAKGIELRKPELDSSLMLLCRPTQVEQILLNLILNAIDAATASEKPWVGIRGCVENGECAVEISDNGLGVPPELRGRIFEPFFTTKDVGEGTGLGLSIAKGLAEANGGRIAIHQDRQPTTFILYLPLAESFKAQA